MAGLACRHEPITRRIQQGDVARIATLIEAGVADGSIPPLDPQATAQTLYQLWLGASLIGKLHRNASALENAMAFTRKLLS